MIRKIESVSDYFHFQLLTKQKRIIHFISTNIRKEHTTVRHDFDICFTTGKTHKEILENRKILAKETGIPLENFVMQRQIHSDRVQIVDAGDRGKGVYTCDDALDDSDAMITNCKNVCLFLFAADCIPVLIYDPIKGVVGAAHSGWKGTVKKIAQKTIEAMGQTYGTKPEDVIVGIGPSIGVSNYEIGSDVATAVELSYGTTEGVLKLNPTTGNFHLDMLYAVRTQLREIGINDDHIEPSDLCTYEQEGLFFSARKNKNTGRFGAGIMLI
jgi:YfiH family protein